MHHLLMTDPDAIEHYKEYTPILTLKLKTASKSHAYGADFRLASQTG